MKNKKVLFLTQAGLIAALYVALTFLANAFGLASGAIQVRLSEMLLILPAFTPAAIPGVYIGCMLSNLLTGCSLLDILLGSLATLIGAIGASLLRKSKWLITIPNIIANMAIVPYVLIVSYGLQDAWWYLVLTVGIGEIISCGIFGMLLYFPIKKHAKHIFHAN